MFVITLNIAVVVYFELLSHTLTCCPKSSLVHQSCSWKKFPTNAKYYQPYPFKNARFLLSNVCSDIEGDMLLAVQMIKFLVFLQRERQVQKEEAQELTEKLDQEWKSIQALMVKKTPKAECADNPEEKPKVGSHQQSARCVAFDRRWQSLIFLCSLFSSLRSRWRSMTWWSESWALRWRLSPQRRWKPRRSSPGRRRRSCRN